MNIIIAGWRETFRIPEPFSPPALEADFLAHYSRQFQAGRAFSGALGVATWAFFLLLDLILIHLDPAFRELAWSLTGTRALAIPMLAATVVLAQGARFARDEAHATRLIMAGSVAMTAFHAFLIAIAPFPYDYLYYFQGMLVALIFTFGMFRLRTRYVLRLMLLMAVLLLAVMWWRTLSAPAARTNLPLLAYSTLATFLIVTVALVGYGVAAQLEHSERKSFRDRRALGESNRALLLAKRESEAHLGARLAAEERLRLDAENRSRDKSRFLAQAVHDLKQPVQAISNALHPVLADIGGNDPARSRELLTLVRDAAGVMRTQLAAILDLSRLESGMVKAELVNFDLLDLLEQLHRQYRMQAAAAGVALTLEAEGAPRPTAASDPVFVERILGNLVGNGIKYRNPDPAVRPAVSIRLVANDRLAEISVSDNGLGIEQELIDSGAIFDAFFQVNNRHPEGERGFGLGLSIVRAMLSLLPGHRLDLSSRPGQGSCFRLVLPTAEALPPKPPVTRDDAVVPAVAGLYLLFVEDDDLVRTSMEAVFAGYGMRCDSCDSYAALVDVMAGIERDPDLLVCDFRLPDGKTAVDVIAHARSRIFPLRVIVFSGEISDLGMLDALEDVTFLRKPLDPVELVKVIGRTAAGGAS